MLALDPYLQMMPGGMGTYGWNWSTMWLFLILPAIAVGIIVIAVVALILRRNQPPTMLSSGSFSTTSKFVEASETKRTGTSTTRPDNAILAEVERSLAPTLMDDERRVMDELVKAGGEILQSDLPRMTDFSKATVSKAIHGLEVRGIVSREKHKWTFWCRVNPRLIERTLQEQPDLQDDKAVGVKP